MLSLASASAWLAIGDRCAMFRLRRADNAIGKP